MTFGERFLSCPDLFPARRSGERLGEASVGLTFAGATFRFESLALRQAASLAARFEGYLVWAERGASFDIEVFQAPPEDFLPYPAGTPYQIEVEHSACGLRLAGRNFMARVELAPRLSAALWLRDSGPADVREGGENLLRVMAAYAALERRGVLVHSAAVARDGQAILFPGRSGAGKSTLSALADAQGWQVLSDELNLIVPCGDGGFAVEQVPFAGDFGRAAPLAGGPFPLAAVVALRHAAAECLLPLDRGRALASLVAASPFINSDPWYRDRLIEAVEEIAASVPGQAFEFRRDGSLEALETLLESVPRAAGAMQ